jgi:hypothetical protein
MLKKLFIGLIILSALTSEGAAVFQAKYCDLLLYAQNELYIPNDTNVPVDLNTQAENKSSALFYKDVLGFGSIKLSVDKERFKLKNSFIDWDNSVNKIHLESDFTTVNDRYVFIATSEPVIEGTDSSPPYYISYI